MDQPSFVNHRIKSIILLLGSAFACASLLVVSLIYHFGPSGRYVAAHALLSPQVMEEISQKSEQNKSKKQQSFVFNSIKFSYFDLKQRSMRQQPVSIENYKKFYEMVAQEKSLDQTDQLALIFTDIHPSILTIAMQAEGNEKMQNSQIFQIVQFKDDYFRVQLHNEGMKGEWAYFQVSNLYSKFYSSLLHHDQTPYFFLGTGSSVGVPVIGCPCFVCHSNSLFNKRLRTSVLLTVNHKQFLIDAGPDFREQALRMDLHHLDGVLLTHAHHDHTAGIDDLRPIYYRRQNPLPILLSAETAQDIQLRYYYIFGENSFNPSFVPKAAFHLLPEKEGVIEFEGISVNYLSYEQGGMLVNGYRIGQLAYLTDIREFSTSIYTNLRGIKDLVISALRHTPSPLHLSIDEAIEFAAKVEAERVWITHLSHDVDYEETMEKLPSHVRLAYDGLEITFE